MFFLSITFFNILWKEFSMNHTVENTIICQRHLNVEVLGSLFTISLIFLTDAAVFSLLFVDASIYDYMELQREKHHIVYL
jgi:hypothetical protein